MPVTPIQADIILYKGTDFLSRAIEFFDDSPYSHASIRLDTDEVAECLAFPFPGLITRNTVANSMDVNHSNQVLVRRMKNRPSDMSPVTSRAKFYLQNGNTYAYFQIAQLAFLTLTRKLFVVPILYDIARAACDIAAKALDSSGDRKPMICSEFVNRCFHEAAPVPNPYALFNQRHLPSNRSKFTLFSWAEGELRSGRNLAKLEEIAPNEPPSIKELESYIEKYLALAEVKPIPNEMETLYTDEMLGSIKRFMNAYTKASMSKAEYKSAANDQITPFIILVDNFITPGDFSNCSDLQDVGTIDAALPKIRTASGEQSGSVRG